MPLSRYGIAIMFALVFLTQVPMGYARPCECKDIDAIKARIKEVENFLDAWRKVLRDTYSNDAPRDLDQLRRRFDRYAFGGTRPANISTAGEITPALGTKGNPKLAQQHCDIVVNAVDNVHEPNHIKFLATHLIPILAGAAFGNPYMAITRNMALSEVRAHEAEKAYLEEELQKLEQRCKGTWRCKCNNQMFDSAAACAQGCPRPSLACIAPTCYEIDPKTGKPTGKAY